MITVVSYANSNTREVAFRHEPTNKTTFYLHVTAASARRLCAVTAQTMLNTPGSYVMLSCQGWAYYRSMPVPLRQNHGLTNVW